MLGTVSLLTVFAGCRGARRSGTSVTPATTAAVSDSATRAVARAAAQRADHLVMGVFLRLVEEADILQPGIERGAELLFRIPYL